MHDVSLFRLYLLRATYLLIAVGLGFMVWPRLLQHSPEWALRHGDTVGLLSGVQLLALVGLRHPVKMIPLLLFELVWKAVWLLTIALPLWRAGPLTPATSESVFACGFGVVVCLVAIPWPHVVTNYVRSAADRWR
jgi:hypothetical protein